MANKRKGRKPCCTGSGNVFKDFGFSDAEAAALERRSCLLITVQEFIKENKFRNSAVAELFGITTETAQHIRDGRISRFKEEELKSFVDKIDKFNNELDRLV